MICKKCQAQIPEGSLFCNLCGAKQTAAQHTAKKRGNGQGTVFKTQAGTWCAQVTLGYYCIDGKKRRKTAQKYGFKTKKEALAYIERLRSTTPQRKMPTCATLWEQFQAGDMKALSASKAQAYKTAWKKIYIDIGYRLIDSFTVAELQDVLDGVAFTFYPARDIKCLLTHLYKIAMRDDFIAHDKAQYLRLPPNKPTERRLFSQDDKDILWQDYNSTQSPISAYMLVMLYTGIRPGELRTIKVENIDIDNQYMTGGIKTEKSRARKIILPDKIMPLIKHLISISKNGLLASDSDFYHTWRDKRTELGLPEALAPYCCRHTYITELTSLKVSPAMLQELAGHEDYETTLTYTHLSLADRLAEVNRLT